MASRNISPHSIRHTTAMHLLQSGVDISVIALWPGHEWPTTTHLYVEADLPMKDLALARLVEPEARIHCYQASDAFLECGVLAHVFLRLRCTDCAHEKLVAF